MQSILSILHSFIHIVKHVDCCKTHVETLNQVLVVENATKFLDSAIIYLPPWVLHIRRVVLLSGVSPPCLVPTQIPGAILVVG